MVAAPVQQPLQHMRIGPGQHVGEMYLGTQVRTHIERNLACGSRCRRASDRHNHLGVGSGQTIRSEGAVPPHQYNWNGAHRQHVVDTARNDGFLAIKFIGTKADHPKT